MEKLIEELTKVNPSNLSEEGLKLFNKINEIIDENDVLKQGVNPSYEETISELEKQLFDSIPKSKVREKIDYYIGMFEIGKLHEDEGSKYQMQAISSIVENLQELLEEE